MIALKVAGQLWNGVLFRRRERPLREGNAGPERVRHGLRSDKGFCGFERDADAASRGG